MPKYKLTYFNMRGRAEAIRMCLAAAGQEFEDVRIAREDWPKEKPNTPLGQMPVLEIDGVQLPQSGAIVRFVAREHGLYGKSNKDMAIVDVVLGTIEDLINVMIKIFMEQDEDKKAEGKKNAKEKELPKFCKFFEKVLVDNGGGEGWMVGSSLSLADIALYCVLETLINAKEYSQVFDLVPKLMAHRQRVADFPALKNYLANRPETDM